MQELHGARIERLECGGVWLRRRRRMEVGHGRIR
jgi:hypothetical protein